jgi:hypothetical protein
MRKIIIVVAGIVLASCADRTKPACEQTAEGAYLWIDGYPRQYEDLIAPLKRARFGDVIAAAPGGPSSVRELHEPPNVCAIAGKTARGVEIAYPRTAEHKNNVILKLYFDENSRPKLAVFYVQPLMP